MGIEKCFGVFSLVTITGNNYKYAYELIEYIKQNVSYLLIVCDEASYEGTADRYDGNSVTVISGGDNHLHNYELAIRLMMQSDHNLDDTLKVVLADSDIMGPVNDMESFWRKLPAINDEIIQVMPVLQEQPDIQYAFCGMSCHMAKRFAEGIDGNHIFPETVNLINMEAPISYLEYCKALKKYFVPFIPVSLFLLEYEEVINKSAGNYLLDVFQYLKDIRYNTDCIWEFLLKARNIADIVKILHLNYSVSTEEQCGEQVYASRAAIIVHVYYVDLIDSVFELCSAILDSFDFFFSTDTPEKKRLIENRLEHYDCKQAEVRLVENRGRDVSSLLVGMQDIIPIYDYICFVHDKKTSYVGERLEGAGFADKCIQNVIYNRTFCNNIINLFESNPRLGIAFPPEPNHASFFPVLGNEWSYNYDITFELAQKLHIERFLDRNKEPVAPLGTCFWFRSEALMPLFQVQWEYKDFPPEPNGTDGTILHACERIYAYVAQERGYYPAYIMADKWFAVEYTNLHYYTRCYNARMLHLGVTGKPGDMIEAIVSNEDVKRSAAVIDNLNKENEELRKYVNYLEQEVIPGLSIKNRIRKLFHKL